MNEAAENQNAQPPTKRKRRFSVRIFSTILFAAVVIAALLVVNSIGGGLSVQSLKRTWTIVTGGASDTEYFFEDGFDAVFADLGGAIVAAGGSGTAVYDDTGRELARDLLAMRNPAVATGAGIAVVYDVGGRGIRVINETGVVASLTFENDIISCSVGSSSGFFAGGTWFAVCTEGADNYRGQVEIYKLAGSGPELIYRWFSGEGYILSAEIAPGNKGFAMLTLSQRGGRIVLLRPDSVEPQGEYVHEGAAIIEIGYINAETLVARTADGLLTVNAAGAASELYSFGGRTVAGYCDDGEALVVYFKNPVSGAAAAEATAGELVVIGKRGEELGRMNTSRSFVWLSAYADKIAALWDDGLIIYDRSLRLIASYPEASGMLQGYSRGAGRAVVFGNREGRAFSGKTE